MPKMSHGYLSGQNEIAINALAVDPKIVIALNFVVLLDDHGF